MFKILSFRLSFVILFNINYFSFKYVPLAILSYIFYREIVLKFKTTRTMNIVWKCVLFH